MSASVKASIAADLARLERVTETPVSPFGYGVDLSCASDLDPACVDVGGNDPLIIAQSCVRRLSCPRGQLPDDGDYGIDVRDYLHAGNTRAELLSLGGEIRKQLAQDDRIATVDVSEIVSFADSSLSISISITPTFSGRPFRLTLAVTSAEVLIKELATS